MPTEPNLTDREKFFVSAAIGMMMLLAITCMAILLLFGFAGLFQLFSVHYDTKRSLIYYVICLIPLSLVFELLTIMILMRLFGKLRSRFSMLLGIYSVTFAFMWLPIYLADEIVSGITVPLYTELIAAFILLAIDHLINLHKKMT